MTLSYSHESVASNVLITLRNLQYTVFFFYVLAGFSPAEMQQMWKELTNGITEDKTTLKGNQDSSANNMSTKVTGRQSGDQQSSSPRRTEWYGLCVFAL